MTLVLGRHSCLPHIAELSAADFRQAVQRSGMNSLHSILVGLDFTPFSRAALRQAARIVAWNKADLHAVHVVDPTWLDHLCDVLRIDRDRLRREASEGARATAIDVAAEGDTARNARVDVLLESPADMLVQVAKSDRADLIVLGVRSPTSGGSDGPRGPGPVSAACVRRAPTQELLVREDQPGGTGPYRVIVACVDFSDTSLRAVQQAVRMAQQDQASLRIVHVPCRHVWTWPTQDTSWGCGRASRGRSWKCGTPTAPN